MNIKQEFRDFIINYKDEEVKVSDKLYSNPNCIISNINNIK